MKKSTLILISFFISLTQVNASIFTGISSSLPPDTEKTMLSLPESKEGLDKMRVLIFPHRLKNDWRHGKKDDPTVFSFISNKKDILVDNVNYQNITFKKENNQILVFSNDQQVKVDINLPLTINLPSKTKLLRKGNEDKSSSYQGQMKIHDYENGFRVIHHLGLEDYLKGVVPSESSASWPIESLKAQAVAARSYAVFHKLSTPPSRNYDVDDTARYQVFTGLSHHDSRTNLAVSETSGEILTYNQKVIIAFFHAYSGGETDSARRIFKMNNIPYCIGKKEDFSNEDLKAVISSNIHWVIEWQKVWDKNKLLSSLKSLKEFNDFNLGEDYQIEVLSRHQNINKTINEMSFIQGSKKVEINFFKMRSTLGWSHFNSYHFNITEFDNSITFNGYGWGHHVGMSQWSAYYMSKFLGSTYEDILYKFYHDVKLQKL